ncbi:MAG TPA: 1-acylglycerol-3-phosphate O-acyltransferase [Tenuifilaceae bacterium]|nr:1-acylglycerol-3-phosphate O-acyltransferase [Tenuifilaceae bacterium]
MQIFKSTLLVFATILLWIIALASCIVFFTGDVVVWFLTFWWDKRLWLLHRYSILWAMFYLKINPFWRVRFEGKENIRKEQVYVIVSNHQSAFDIILLYRLYTHFKWVAKKELAKVPFIGWNLLLNNHIFIERGSAVSAKKMMEQGMKHLRMGSSLLIFPEGTRSADGTIHRFKDGAFILAQKSEKPILPVVIDGSGEIMQNPLKLKLAQTLTIKILPEISYESFREFSPNELARHVQQLMEKEHMAIAPERYHGSMVNS